MRYRLLIALLMALALLGGFYTALQAAPAPRVVASSAQQINLSNSEHALFPSISQAADGTIHVVWSDDELGAYNIYSTQSSDNGQTWDQPAPIAATGYNSANPSMVISDTLPRVAWSDSPNNYDCQIYQADIGQGTSLIIPSTHQLAALYPSLSAGPDGELHLAFAGKRTGENASILYARRPAGASAWATATVVYSSTYSGLNPSLAYNANDEELHLVWNQQIAPSVSRVMYMTATVSASDVIWSGEAQDISAPDVNVWRPRIAIAPNGDIHVVWSERASGEAIYLHYNRYAGGSWQGLANIGGISYKVNDTTPYSLMSVIDVSADSQTICVAWNALPSVAAEGEDIFLTCSNDGGVTWPERENMTQNPSTISTHPALLIDSEEQVHLAWQEQIVGGNPNTDYQIFYAHHLANTVYLPMCRWGR